MESGFGEAKEAKADMQPEARGRQWPGGEQPQQASRRTDREAGKIRSLAGVNKGRDTQKSKRRGKPREGSTAGPGR